MIQGCLLLLVLFTATVSIYISQSFSRDQSNSQQLNTLRRFFSPRMIETLEKNEDLIERYYQRWLSVFFIDIVGFTSKSEQMSSDIEGVAEKLRNVMDIAREIIVENHQGIVDKFMGDAVMGWIGGHFSTHWNQLSDSRRQLFQDEIEDLERNIANLQRISPQHQQIHQNKPAEQKSSNSSAQLKALKEELEDFKDKVEANMVSNPLLLDFHEKQMHNYKKTVVRSAVSCCLEISQRVSEQKDPTDFTGVKIGIASGNVLVGNFGSSHQLGFTVLGHTVNLAARLESASGQFGCRILIDQESHKFLADDPDFAFRQMPRFMVKGISNTDKFYEPFWKENVNLEFLSHFNLAVQAIENDELENSIRLLSCANDMQKDNTTRFLIEQCQRALQSGQQLQIHIHK